MESGYVDEDILYKRKNHVGPPSNMTRRLIKPKKKKKKKGAGNDENMNIASLAIPTVQGVKKPKIKTKRKSGLRLKKFLSFNEKPKQSVVKGFKRNTSVPRKINNHRYFRQRGARSTKSKPPMKTGKRRSQTGSGAR